MAEIPKKNDTSKSMVGADPLEELLRTMEESEDPRLRDAPELPLLRNRIFINSAAKASQAKKEA